MDHFKAIFELRDLLRDMERDVGLDKLSPSERDVFLAARSLTDQPGEVIGSDAIRSHKFVRSIAQATYHRALRTLVGRGMLARAEGTKAKSYVVASDIIES